MARLGLVQTVLRALARNWLTRTSSFTGLDVVTSLTSWAIHGVPHSRGTPTTATHSRPAVSPVNGFKLTGIIISQRFSSSRNAYLQFCEFTIQCLHTTVSHLNLHEQRLPSDRPYTNGYFLDLVSQVRRYAAMVQASRDAAQAAQSGEGEAKNTM